MRTERKDALTVYFFHHIDAAPGALQRDVVVALGDDDSAIVLDDGRMHALYAVRLLTGALAYEPLREFALARILDVLGGYLPRPLPFEQRVMDDMAAESLNWVADNEDGVHAAMAAALGMAIKRAQELLDNF